RRLDADEGGQQQPAAEHEQLLALFARLPRVGAAAHGVAPAALAESGSGAGVVVVSAGAGAVAAGAVPAKTTASTVSVARPCGNGWSPCPNETRSTEKRRPRAAKSRSCTATRLRSR